MSAVENSTGLSPAFCLGSCLIVLTVLWTMPALADDESPFILLLFSYSSDHPWVEEEKEAFMQNFRLESPDAPPPRAEYMDCRSWPDGDYERRLIDLYSYKYSRQRLNRSIDLVIAFDIPAGTLALANRKELFPDAYLILAGMMRPGNNTTGSNYSLERTGFIQQRADPYACLQAMHDLHPQAGELLVLLDGTPEGRALADDLDDLASEFNGQFNLTLAEISPGRDIGSISSMNLSSVYQERDLLILCGLFGWEGDDFPANCSQMGRIINPNLQVPVYGLWDFQMGQGIVGGCLASGRALGERAASTASAALRGESLPQIQNIFPLLKFDRSRWRRMA